ncbi:MAG: diguanylate cyclase, partial [Gammaproteobacteria bacterium]|nr:diguanylate cyclase [Gammaproteobacteria bacterium]
MGDECSRLIAGVIKDNFKRTADYTGKYNETQFLTILSDCTHEGAMVTAENIRQSVQKLEILFDGKTTNFITVSIGCLTVNNLKSTSLDALLENSQELIRRSMADGGNRISAMET